MNNVDVSVADMNQRLIRLEKKASYWQKFSLGAVLFAVIAVSGAAVSSGASSVAAERFVLLDSDGNERGVWEMLDKDNQVLRFQSRGGNLQASIHSSTEVSGVHLRTNSGYPRANLSVSNRLGSSLYMSGRIKAGIDQKTESYGVADLLRDSYIFIES